MTFKAAKSDDTAKSIQPLFLLVDTSHAMGHILLELADSGYNQSLGATLIGASNDADAIASFLNEYRDSPATLRAYAKEIERLLLWCVHVAHVNIASLRRDHLLQYQQFLKNPTPKNLWCGPNVGRRKKDGTVNPAWRPFVKGLSNASINTALTVMDSFFNYLVQADYLTGNPLAVDRRRKKRHTAKPRIIDRYLEHDELVAVLDALSSYPCHDDQQAFQVARARYIILLLFYTGLRIAEAANHQMKDFIQREHCWFLRVVGKGKKRREIPIPDALLDALSAFRTRIKLPSPLPTFREPTPLIPRQNLTQPISARRIDQILRWAFHLGAASFEPDEPRKASKLRSASAHWLRHSYVTYLLDSGAPLKVAQENAGHQDIGTTMHYRHVAQTDRHTATKALSLANHHVHHKDV